MSNTKEGIYQSGPLKANPLNRIFEEDQDGAPNLE